MPWVGDELARWGIAALRQANPPCLNKRKIINKSSKRHWIVKMLAISRAKVVVEINNLTLIQLLMIQINWIIMKNNRLMGVCLKAMLVWFTAMIVLRIQMRMRRHPLDRQKGGQQKKNKHCVDSLLNHGCMEFKLELGTAALIVYEGRLYTYGSRIKDE